MPWNRIEAGGIVRCGSTRRLNACSGRTAPPTDHLALGDIAPEAGYAGEEQQLNATVQKAEGFSASDPRPAASLNMLGVYYYDAGKLAEA